MRNTPKTLEEVKSQDLVLSIRSSDSPESSAAKYLNNLFPNDDRSVCVRFLFKEIGIESGAMIAVYEAYKDSGSDDYVYLLQPL